MIQMFLLNSVYFEFVAQQICDFTIALEKSGFAND